MSPLVEKLTKGEHPVSLIRYQGRSGVEEAIGRGLVLVRFTDTHGGTEIGVSLEQNARAVDLEDGRLSLCGALTLDYQPVKCTVNIDPQTLTGYGFLQVVDRGSAP